MEHASPCRSIPKAFPSRCESNGLTEVEDDSAFVDSFAAVGVDEIIFNLATADVDEVGRLAEVVF